MMHDERALADRVAALESSVGELAGAVSRLRATVEGLRRESDGPRSLSEHVGAGEAARLLGCDTSTVRRHLRAGRLKGEAIEIPGMVRRRWSIEVESLRSLKSLLPAGACLQRGDAGHHGKGEQW